MVLPTPYFSDLGAPIVSNVTFSVDMAEQIYLGNFNPANGDVATVEGMFNGWTHDVYILTNDLTQVITEPGGVLRTNVYTETFPVTNSPAGIEEYKFVIYNTVNSTAGYEGPGALNADPDSGNRFFALATPAQPLPLVYFSDAPFSLVLVSNITFSVDMSIVAITDTNYNPATVTVNGTIYAGYTDVSCTNNPTAANTNIYTSTMNYTLGLGSMQQYQFRYKTKDNATYVYDHATGGGNRLYTVINTNPNGTNLASVWNDASANDYFFTPQAVKFSVNMANAVTTTGHTFVPSSGYRLSQRRDKRGLV